MRSLDELSEEELEYLYRRVCKEHAGKDLLFSKIGVVRKFFGDAVSPEELAGLSPLSSRKKEAGFRD
jgi:hypothetical protein